MPAEIEKITVVHGPITNRFPDGKITFDGWIRPETAIGWAVINGFKENWDMMVEHAVKINKGQVRWNCPKGEVLY